MFNQTITEYLVANCHIDQDNGIIKLNTAPRRGHNINQIRNEILKIFGIENCDYQLIANASDIINFGY